DCAALERSGQPAEELAGPRGDEWSGRLDVRSLDERIGGGRAELGLDLLLDLLAESALEIGAQAGERVELARRLCQLVVERRQNLLLQLLEHDLDLRRLSAGQLVLDVPGLARRHAVPRELEPFAH